MGTKSERGDHGTPASGTRTRSTRFLVLSLAAPALALLLLLGCSGAEEIEGKDGTPSVGDLYFPHLGTTKPSTRSCASG